MFFEPEDTNLNDIRPATPINNLSNFCSSADSSFGMAGTWLVLASFCDGTQMRGAGAPVVVLLETGLVGTAVHTFISDWACFVEKFEVHSSTITRMCVEAADSFITAEV